MIDHFKKKEKSFIVCKDSTSNVFHLSFKKGGVVQIFVTHYASEPWEYNERNCKYSPSSS